ncbi:hypothetical protein HPB51_017847 [Rhipicephalus microplus]|uniref:Cytoplasmic dynein 2 light intermediate chain 1 n=1 Tax=Rhipicephalus microplus TaxID=6941 RepID=A0A9J6E3C3_RHIMP|nr:hypothetical protein HPB51_017847 [Rhipicephalus microplus]
MSQLQLKDICHIWELAGGAFATDLLEIPITMETLQSLSVIMVLDLSAPEVLCILFETLLKALQSRIDRVLDGALKNDASINEAIHEASSSRLPNEHPDKKAVTPFPVPLLIIGSKYDIFQNYEPEKRKVACRYLRHVAHANGASLLLTSSKNESLISRLKTNLAYLAFGSGSGPIKASHTDYNKPLHITLGEDSFERIAKAQDKIVCPERRLRTNASLQPPSSRLPSPLRDVIAEEVAQTVPVAAHHQPVPMPVAHALPMQPVAAPLTYAQVEQKMTIPEDPSRDPKFKEKDIDLMKAQKEAELAELRKRRQDEERARELPDFD